MGKRKTRRTYRPRKQYRGRSKAKVPIEVVIAGVSIPFTPAADGFTNIVDSAMNQDFTGVMDNLKCGFLGMEPVRGTTQFNLMAALNPFDFNHARFTKMLMYSGIIGMVRRKITGRYTNKLFSKIPFIGRWVN